MADSASTVIAFPSAASLYLEPRFSGKALSAATGFLVAHDDEQFLVTNWHVVSGRDPQTNQPLNPQTGAVPDIVAIVHNAQGRLGTWVIKEEALYDGDGNPTWLEAPRVDGRRIDVVALPLTERDGIEPFAPYNPWNPGPALAWGVGRPLSIIGFPLGRTAGGFLPIWIQGWVASEPAIDFEGLPMFLIDARTREGQSGSPVIMYANGGMVPMADGGSAVFAGDVAQFVGVYSSRFSNESDLGHVWKAEAVQRILEERLPGSV